MGKTIVVEWKVINVNYFLQTSPIQLGCTNIILNFKIIANFTCHRVLDKIAFIKHKLIYNVTLAS